MTYVLHCAIVLTEVILGMSVLDLKTPYVIGCYTFSSNSTSFRYGKRVVENYELDFNLCGGRTVYVNENKYEVEKNSIILRRPGDIAKSKGVYDMYALTFAFDKIAEHKQIYSRNTVHQSYNTSNAELLNQLPAYMKPRHTNEIIEIYKRLMLCFDADIYEELCSQLVTKLLYLLAVEAINIKISADFPYNTTVNKIISYISEHYGESITLDMIADNVNLDKSYIIRCFKKATGKTPIEYLTEKRIEMAKSLLSETDLNVSEIASLCGFSDASYFTLKFRTVTGITPTSYKNSIAY